MSKNKFTLNFKDWKKVKEDKHHTTMEHKSGHQLKLAHAQLSPENKKALASLPAVQQAIKAPNPAGQMQAPVSPAGAPPVSAMMFGGGRIKDTSTAQTNTERFQKGFDPESSTEPAEDTETIYSPTSESVPVMAKAKGGMIKPHFADGTDDGTVGSGYGVPASQQPTDPNPQLPPTPAPTQDTPAQAPAGGDLLNQKADYYQATNPGMNRGDALARAAIEQQAYHNMQSQDTAYDASHTPTAMSEQAQASLPKTPAEAAAMDAAKNAGVQAAPQIANQSSQPSPVTSMQQDVTKQAQAQDPSDPFGVNAAYQTFGQGYNNTMEGMRNEMAARQAGQAQEAVKFQDAAHATAQVNNDYQAQYKNLLDLNDQHQAALRDAASAQNLGPNHYLDNMSTGKHIRTMLGLVIGGFGAGLTGNGNNNQALDFLNKQIDRDIDTQKTRVNTEDNLLNANLKMFGNARDAADMTRANIQGALMQTIQGIEARTNSAASKGRLQQLYGNLQMQNYQTIGSLAMRKAMLNGTANGNVTPERTVSALFQDPHQLEGAQKELESMRNAVSDRDAVLNAYYKIANQQTLSNRVLSPFQSRSIIKQEIGTMLPATSKETAGRFSGADAAMLEQAFLPALTANKDTVANGAQALNDLMMKHAKPQSYPKTGVYPQIYQGVVKDSRYDEQGRPKINMAPVQAPPRKTK